MLEDPTDKVKLASAIYFFVILACCVAAIISVVGIYQCKANGFRHLLYVACVVLSLTTLIGFILSVVLSLAVPVAYLSC